MGSIRIETRLSGTEARDIAGILTAILLDILPEEIRKTGKGREYFEGKMLGNWFPDLSEDEKVLVVSLTKAVLDKAFPA